MRKNLLSTVFVAILLVFVGCSSDSSSSSCNEAALEAEFEAAMDKYETSNTNEDCLKAVAVIKKALANKCITQEEADSYGAGLDCYTSGGGDTDGDCEVDYQSAIDAFKANKTEENCENATNALEDAVEAGCLTQSEAMQIGVTAGLAMCN